jgi:hypothetical protein
MRPALLCFAAIAAGCNFHVAGIDAPPPDFTTTVHDGSAALHDLATADLNAPVDLRSGRDLSGPFITVTSAATKPPIDLTKEGKLDWAHWGYAVASDYDHKASGNGQISNYTQIGGIGVFQFSDGAIAYSWSDGLGGTGQNASATNSTTGVYNVGKGNGFRLAAPADHTIRHLRLYVGGYQATGEVHVGFMDNSVPAFDEHAYGSISDQFNVTYDIHYQADGLSQLVITWTDYGGANLGNVTLQAATLLEN